MHLRTVLRFNNLQHRKPHLSNKVIVYDLKLMFMSYMTNNDTHNIKTFKSRLQFFWLIVGKDTPLSTAAAGVCRTQLPHDHILITCSTDVQKTKNNNDMKIYQKKNNIIDRHSREIKWVLPQNQKPIASPQLLFNRKTNELMLGGGCEESTLHLNQHPMMSNMMFICTTS